MTSAPVAAKAYPGVMKSSARPVSGRRRQRPPDGLEHAHGCRPDGDDAAAGGAGRVDRRGRLLPHLVRLGVEGVVGQVVGGHRAERVDADGERHLDDLEPAPHVGPHLGREVQARRRRRRRARRARVDGLVVVGAVERPVDVGRHRHLPDPLEHVGTRYGTLDGDGHVTLLQHLGHEDRRARGVERLAGAQAAGRAGERVPGAVATPLQEQQFDGPAGGAAGVDAGGQHAGVVHDDEVVGPELVGQVRKRSVPDLARRAVVHQEPRARARLGRLLGDQVGGECVVELGGAHRREYRPLSRTRTSSRSMRYVALPMCRMPGPARCHTRLRSTARMWMWPPRHEPFTWKSIFAEPGAVGVLDHRALDREPRAGDDAEQPPGRPVHAQAGGGEPERRPLRRALDRAQARCRGGRQQQDGAEDERDPRTRSAQHARDYITVPVRRGAGRAPGAGSPRCA